MNPLGALITLLLSALVLVLPRPKAAAAIIAGVCCITEGQELNLGFHFTAIRLIALVGLFRVATRGELKQIRFNSIDGALVAYVIGELILASLRTLSINGFVYELGGLYNRMLPYFVLRALLTSWKDLREMLLSLIVLLIPFAVLMAFEARTNHNLFSIFGGVFESSMIRDDQIRAQGPFRSPITAGSFGAIFAMLYAVILFSGERPRFKAIIGLATSIVILLSAHSSGPLLGLAIGLGSLAIWRFRQHMRKLRWAMVLGLIALHMVMKAPVWFIMARLSDVVGGGGFHRAELIDIFINSFSSWWLVGMNAIDTAKWFPYALSIEVGGGADITNQFVADGIRAGLIGLFLSIRLFVRCFQSVGRALRETNNPSVERIAWGLGATLTSSVGIQFSVTYFDQMYVVGFFLMACICTISREGIDPAFTDEVTGLPLESKEALLPRSD